jgi:hypothetical protein
MCIHHWLIDYDNVGRCKYCLAVQKFPNYLEIETPAMQHSSGSIWGLHSDTGTARTSICRTRSNEQFHSLGIYL